VSRDANSRLIAVARESRGLTQKQLADRMEISQSKLSKYESGALSVSDSDLQALSHATGYTASFFGQGDEVFGLGTICVFHRKKASVSVGDLRRIQAKLNIFRMAAARIRDGVEVDTRATVPEMDPDEFGGPECVAREVRRVWQLPLGPVANLTATIERAGVIVFKTDFGIRGVDAVSQKVHGYPTVFMLNSRASGDRLRFSLAHELAHVVMHRDASPDMEQQANAFASELLMPAAEIGINLRHLTIDKAAQLKRFWRVSMQAIIKRAADLGRISPRHYQTLFTQMSKNGWRMKEPVQIEPESPTVLRDIFWVHMREHGVVTEGLADTMFLTDPREFIKTYGDGSPGILRVV
jgi:Zn-dependent peptidase ImmA (M78 family)/transcriptional regulator with XRE-family HTH domain